MEMSYLPLSTMAMNIMPQQMPCLIDEENTPIRRIRQRVKQLMIGKMTEGYKNFRKVVPLDQRDPAIHIDTPRHDQDVSKRQWEKELKAWRKFLHLYDNACPQSEDETDCASTSSNELRTPMDHPVPHPDLPAPPQLLPSETMPRPRRNHPPSTGASSPSSAHRTFSMDTPTANLHATPMQYSTMQVTHDVEVTTMFPSSPLTPEASQPEMRITHHPYDSCRQLPIMHTPTHNPSSCPISPPSTAHDHHSLPIPLSLGDNEAMLVGGRQPLGTIQYNIPNAINPKGHGMAYEGRVEWRIDPEAEEMREHAYWNDVADDPTYLCLY